MFSLVLLLILHRWFHLLLSNTNNNKYQLLIWRQWSGYKYRLIGLVGSVFANGPGDLGSILGRVLSKTKKMVLDNSLLNTQHYKVRFKDKVEQPRKRSSSPPTPQCSSYWKGSLRVILDYSGQLYLQLLFSLTLFIYLPIVKWFRVLQCNTNNSI